MPVRLRLDLAYDGRPFAGWARQPGLLTVQGVLEDALTVLLRQSLPSDDAAARAAAGLGQLTVAGRTDAGVHARGQVAHAQVPVGVWTRSPGRSDVAPEVAFVRRLNALVGRRLGVLGVDAGAAVIHRAAVAAPGFDARFSALWRRYVYRVCDRPELRDPLTRGWIYWHGRELDEGRMHAAAQALLGEHDFLAYCKPREGATTIRTLQRLDVRRAAGGVIELEVQADAFCHSMVRALVGSLLQVGQGRAAPEMPAIRLAARTHVGMQVAPPHGLTLEEVHYPASPELAARAAQARQRRRREGCCD